MKISAHVFRRGAVYVWRRRIPLACRNSKTSTYIQLSMRTYDPKIARTIGAILHGKSEQVFELMAEASLTQQEAKAWLEHVVTEELKRIQTRRLVEQDSPETGAFEDNRLVNRRVKRDQIAA